jgi:DNA-directed RNA polymerase specialized sigma24 family protein
VPEPNAERKRRAREDGRRRQAVALLNVAGGMMHYAVRQLGNGIGPEQARAVAADAAGELAVLAAELRRLTRLGPEQRRALAVRMVALGMTRHEAAIRLGVSDATVRNYLAGRRGTGRASQAVEGSLFSAGRSRESRRRGTGRTHRRG